MNICSGCGNPISRNEKACPYCGKIYNNGKETPIRNNKCRKCGSSLNPTSGFCPYCGSREVSFIEDRNREIRSTKSKRHMSIIAFLIALVVVLTGTVVFLLSETDDEKILCRVVRCDEKISLRESPSINAGKIISIPLGATVEFLEESENGYYKVKYSGQVGYCLPSYLSFEGDKIPNSDKNKTSVTVVNCESYITLRGEPLASGTEMGKINLGERVKYICTAENGYCCVEYDGQRGFVLKKFLAV